MTKTITVDFLKPVFLGKELRAEGKVLVVISEREAEMAGYLYDEDDELCAKSIGKFALFTPEAIRKKGLTDQEILTGLELLMAE